MVFYLLIGVLLLAAANDLRNHRIPNWLTFPAMAGIILFHTGMQGLEGFLFSIEGLGIGIAILILPYLMGGFGAGDVKLMGVVGAALGPKDIFAAFFFTAIAGGIYAFATLLLRGFLEDSIKRIGTILKTFILTKQLTYPPPIKGEKRPRLSYGCAISLGTIISIFWPI